MSLVLNNAEGRFTEATAQRVRAAAERLGYQISGPAKALRTGRSDLVIAVLPPYGVVPTIQTLLDTLSGAASILGLSTAAWFTRPGSDPISEIRALRPAVVLDMQALSHEQRTELTRSGIALIPEAPSADALAGFRTDPAIAVAQLDILIDRPITFVGIHDGDDVPRFSRDRAEALRAEARRRGLVEPRVEHTTLNLDDAIDTIRRLPAVPAALACVNDDVAIAMLAACRVLGRRVPDDVAIVGVDGTPIGQLQDPPLTTLRIDIHLTPEVILDELQASLDGRTTGRDLSPNVAVVPGGTAAVAGPRPGTSR